MAAVPQTQVRCNECNRRLGDYVNEVTTGQVILELKCPKCGAPHTEDIRNPHRWESLGYGVVQPS